jgi:sterol desaturase/sphingolipid hydroxylase (fatty acid hydroxylase superfamily)
MAELHRWHHSPLAAEANHNYGGNLIVWDIVFGTRWLPEDREPPVETGIEELPNFPGSYRALMTAPFRWRRLVREAGR